jgi:hypothetical protein
MQFPDPSKLPAPVAVPKQDASKGAGGVMSKGDPSQYYGPQK